MWFIGGGSSVVGGKSVHYCHRQQLSQLLREGLMASGDGIAWAKWHNTMMHWIATNQMYLLQEKPLVGVIDTMVSVIVPWNKVKELSVCWNNIKMQYLDF